MKKELLLVLLITILGAIVSYQFAGSLLIYLATLGLGAIFLFIIKINNSNRKENLNIIRDEDKLYFYLSDDLLFSVNLSRNKNFTETLKESITKEMSTIKNITRKICFINFRDDKLLHELNSSLQLKKES